MENKLIQEKEDLNKKSIDKQEIFLKDSDSKTPNNITNANNVRGMFMNEHISKEEQLQALEKKRKMKEFLELKFTNSYIF